MQQRLRVAQLSKVPLFANCSKRDLSRLLSRTRTEMVEAGHTLFVEGAPSRNLYVILSGSAVVRKQGRRIGDTSRRPVASGSTRSSAPPTTAPRRPSTAFSPAERRLSTLRRSHRWVLRRRRRRAPPDG